MRSSARHLLLVATLLVAALSAHSQFGSGAFGDKTTAPEIGIDAKFTKPVDGRIDGVVTVTIPETWHVNSWKPKDEFAIPTKIRVESAAIKIDTIDYPPHV